MYKLLLMLLLGGQMTYANSTVVAGYYENWSQYRPANAGRPVFMPNLIDPTILTDIFYAFAIFGYVSRSVDPQNPHLTGDYTIQPVEWNDQTVLYPQVQALKQINPNLKTHLSIGGWNFNNPDDPNGMGQYTYRLFSEMVASSSNRAQFIQSAVSYLQQYGFNGIDIDWEYPGDLTRGGTPEDFDNFITFLQELSVACHAANLSVTYTSAALVPAGVPQSYRDNPDSYYQWLASCSQYLDWLNLMCYDYHGAFDVPKLTGVNAPVPEISNTLQNYLKNGVSPKKIVMGMPTYGHSFAGVSGMTEQNNGPGLPFTSAGPAGPSTAEPGLLAYYEIADMVSLKQLTFATDLPTKTAYGFNLTTQEWVSFDTPDTIAIKAQLILSNNLLGGMFWAIDDDEYWWDKFPNIRSGFNVLKAGQLHEGHFRHHYREFCREIPQGI